MSQSYTLVLDLTADDAHNYFLENKSYCNLSLPPYFDFSKLLSELSLLLSGRILSNYFGSATPVKNMADTMDLNHVIHVNKNSNLSWRPFQLIHPLAYLALVNVLTEEKNWKKIQNRFKKIRSLSKVSCLSIPIAHSSKNTSNQGEQILQWWTGIEQKSIALSLKYDYIFNTDVADCYSSIYTHSLAWAIDGIKLAKTINYRNGKDTSGNSKPYLGNKIDRCIQQMQNRQTNGIPQGSVLMDFVAEILFNYLDLLLTSEIKKQKISCDDYTILRFRDDYRIFVKNKADGEKIIRILASLLRKFGLKLNENKTFGSNDIITNSIKQDKIPSLEIIFNEKIGLQKKLLILREHSKSYPNAGSIFRLLNHLRSTADLNEFRINHEVIISILLDIGINNPKVMPNICAFISDLLPLTDSPDHIKDLVFNKLKNMSNSGLSQIWLQRILKDNLQHYCFIEKLCQQVNPNAFPSDLWNISWLPNNSKGNRIKQIMETTPIICWDTFNKLSENVSSDEVDVMSAYLY